MSATVRLSSKLPGDPEINGLDATVDSLEAEPAQIRVALVWYDVARVTLDTDSGASIPTVRVRRFEPLGAAKDAPVELAKLAEDAQHKRTGRTPLPIDQLGDHVEVDA